MAKERKVPGSDHPITVEPHPGRVVVDLDGRVIADTGAALVLREADYPPVLYLPLQDVDQAALRPSASTTYCPYKGDASYFSLVTSESDEMNDAVWVYNQPYPAVAAIAGHVAFYPDRVHITSTD